MTADEWNALYPPGTAVIYEGPEGGEHIVTKTIGRACADHGDGNAIVQVEARAPCWCDVDRMRPITASPVDAFVNAALEAAACAVEALPWVAGDASPWPLAAKTVRARKIPS